MLVLIIARVGYLKKLVLVVAFLSLFWPGSTVFAEEVQPAPVELKDSPILITGYQAYTGGFDFIQIYNNSSQMINLEGWRLEWKIINPAGSSSTIKIALQNWLPGNEFAIIAEDGAIDGADLEYQPNPAAGDVTELKIVPPPGGFAAYTTKGNLFSAGRYAMEPTSAGNFSTARPFVLAGADSPLYGGGLYSPPPKTNLKIVEILANSRRCSPQDANTDLTCHNYIKLFNPTNKPIALDFYRLRAGWGNDNPGINNTFSLGGTLAPGQYLTVVARDDGKPLDLTASGGYVWLEDSYGISKYENTAYRYPDLGGENYRGFSWAMDDSGKWHWAVPAPSGANDFSQRPKIKTTTSTLVPCKPGQQRNPATNRCRSTVSATSTLKPCQPGQTRNPATNRCRGATSTSALKPCMVGQERNPETNRCRKVAAASTSLPSIQDIESAPDGRNYRWWIVGLVAAGAIGFATWEWRRDIASWLSRFKKPSGSPPT